MVFCFLCLRKRDFSFLALLCVSEQGFFLLFHLIGGKWPKLLHQQHPSMMKTPLKAEWWLHSSCQHLSQWLVEKQLCHNCLGMCRITPIYCLLLRSRKGVMLYLYLIACCSASCNCYLLGCGKSC